MEQSTLEVPNLKLNPNADREEKGRRKGAFFFPWLQSASSSRHIMTSLSGRGGLLGIKGLAGYQAATLFGSLTGSLPGMLLAAGAVAVTGFLSFWLPVALRNASQGRSYVMGETAAHPGLAFDGRAVQGSSIGFLKEGNPDFNKLGQILELGAVQAQEEQEARKKDREESSRLPADQPAGPVVLEHADGGVRDAVADRVLTGDLAAMGSLAGGSAPASAGSSQNLLRLGPVAPGPDRPLTGAAGRRLKSAPLGKLSRFAKETLRKTTRVAARWTKHPSRAFYQLQAMRSRQYAAVYAKTDQAAFSESAAPYDNGLAPKGLVNGINTDGTVNPQGGGAFEAGQFSSFNGGSTTDDYAHRQQLKAQQLARQNGSKQKLSKGQMLWWIGIALIIAGIALLPWPTTPIGVALILAGLKLLQQAKGQAAQGDKKGKEAKKVADELEREGQFEAARNARKLGEADENQHPSNGYNNSSARHGQEDGRYQGELDSIYERELERKRELEERNDRYQPGSKKYDPADQTLTQNRTVLEVDVPKN